MGLRPIPPNSQIDNPDSYRESIPEAANRKPEFLKVGLPVDIATVMVQDAVQGACRTPPVAVVANSVKLAVTVAARQACETAAISSSSIRSCPMGGTGFFHRSTSNGCPS